MITIDTLITIVLHLCQYYNLWFMTSGILMEWELVSSTSTTIDNFITEHIVNPDWFVPDDTQRIVLGFPLDVRSEPADIYGKTSQLFRCLILSSSVIHPGIILAQVILLRVLFLSNVTRSVEEKKGLINAGQRFEIRFMWGQQGTCPHWAMPINQQEMLILVPVGNAMIRDLSFALR